MPTLAEMEAELAKRKEERDRIMRRIDDLATAIADCRAQALGVKIGSVIRVKSSRGWGNNRKEIVRRYRVVKIAPCGYRAHELQLIGQIIRKDGTLGERHDIWRDWELEPDKSVTESPVDNSPSE